MKKIAGFMVTALMLTACGNADEETPEKSSEVEINTEDSNVQASNEIEVSIQAEPNILDDDRVKFSGETNLPDDGQLMFTVNGPKYRAQTKAFIKNGEFETDVFSDHGKGLPAGEYTLEVSLSIASTQDASFVKRAGEDYRYLSGNLMEISDLGKTMHYETDFTIEGAEQASEGDSQAIPLETLKEIFSDYSAADDELVSLRMDGDKIIAAIKLASNQYFGPEDLAPNHYSQLTDELLDHEGWQTLTIEYVGVGTISMNKTQSEQNEYGVYFPMLEIEKSLK